jgi:hypothetical protein
MPDVARLRSASAEFPGEVRTKLQAPLPNAPVRDRDPVLGQDQLDVPQAEAEDVDAPI